MAKQLNPAFAQLVEKKNDPNNRVDDVYVSRFLQDSEKFMERLSGDSGRSSGQTSDAPYSYDKKKMSANLRQRSNIVRQYLGRNATAIGRERYTALSSYLDQFQNQLDHFDASEKGLEAYAFDKKQQVAFESSEEGKRQRRIDQMAFAPLMEASPHYYQLIQQYSQDTSYKEMNDRWSEGARREFGYLYAQDKKKAEEFAIQVNNALNAREKDRQRKAIQEKSTSSFPAGARETGKAILAGMTGIGDFANDVAEYQARGHITEKGDRLTPKEYSDAVIGGISEHLNKEWGTLDGTGWAKLAEQTANYQRTGNVGDMQDLTQHITDDGRGMGDIYGIGVSSATSMLSGHVLGRTGSLVQFFGSAAASAVDDAKNRGASDEQALAYGAALGASESLTELIPIDNLLNIGKAADLKGALWSILKQSGEEFLGEGINSVISNIADNYIMADKSNFHVLKQQYMDKGFSDEDAGKQAWLDLLGDIAFDAISGGISGGLSGATVIGIRNGIQKIIGDNTNVGVDNASANADNTIPTPNNATPALDNATDVLEKPTPSGVTAKNLATAEESSEIVTGKNGLQVEQAEQGTISNLEKVGAETSSTVKTIGVPNSEAIQTTLDIHSFSKQFVGQEKYVRDNYTGQQTPEEYEIGFKTAYTLGLNGKSREALNNIELYGLKYLSESQRSIAYDMGAHAAAANKAAQAKATAKADTPSIGRQARLIFEDGSDGGSVTISKITEINKDSITFQLEDGRSVTDDDLSFEDDEEEIYSTLWELGMDVESANSILHSSAGSSLSSTELTEAITDAFRYGRYGYGTAALSKAQEASKLPEAVRMESYRAGEKQAKNLQEEAREREAEKPNTEPDASQRGSVDFDGDTETLNDVQETSLKALEWIAEVTGAKIYVRDMSTPDGLWNRNGVYDPSDDSILIDLRAGQDGTGTLLYTAAHEFVHRMKARSESKFYRLADFLVAEYGKKGISADALVRQQMADSAAQGIELTYDEAFEEMVADAMEAMFTGTDVMAKMAKLKRQDKPLWQEIKDFILGLAEKIRSVYSRLKPDSAEARYVLKMKDSIDQLAELFAEGVMDAGAEKNTTQNGGVKYSLKGYSEHQKKNWATSKRIVVFSDSAQLTHFIQDSIVNKTMDKKMYFGAISTDLANRIQNDTGLNVEGYNLSLGSYEVRKILKDHGNESKETPRGQRAIVADDFSHIVDVVLNPTKVTLSEDQYMGKPAIIFTGDHNGRMNVVAVVSDKRLDLFVQTIYVNVKKEGNLATPTGDQAPANTPEANNGTVSFDSSIKELKQEVKEKNSVRKTQPSLEAQNKKLQEDVDRLRELLKLQGKVTKGTKFKPSSVEAAARYLKGKFNVGGDTKELAKKLNGFYEYIATDKELTWESVKEQAAPVVDWLLENEKFQRSQYAQEILDSMKGRRFALDEKQKAEAEYRHGSYGAYQKLTRGMVSSNAEISLDTFWQEMAAEYPGIFDSEISSSDMPQALLDVLDQLEGMEDTDFAMDWRLKEQAMLQEVYDSYWRVDNLYTVADRNQKQINELRGRHFQKMTELRQDHIKKVQKLKDDKNKIMENYRERREKTVMRHKIERVVNELNDLLTKPTKTRHVQPALQKPVAEMLDALNMGTEEKQERIQKQIARYQELIAKEKSEPNPQLDVIEAYKEKVERLESRGDKLSANIARLKDAYSEIQKSSDPETAGAYMPEITERLDILRQEVGDTPLQDMSLAQMDIVYEAYKLVLHNVRNANKIFKGVKGATVKATAESAMTEIGSRKKRSKLSMPGSSRLSKMDWDNMKPIYAVERIGSATMNALFGRVRGGEDTWMTDLSEARDFRNEKAKKYGFDKWNFDKRYEFTAASGDTFSLDLEQIMSIYAYSKRKQADDHLAKGGVVFAPNTKVVTKTLAGGIKVVQDLNDATAYNLPKDVQAEIIDTLTDKQKAFVDDMRDYLSDVMGAKGNEVSLEMYGVKLFNEKYYFPLKSASQYMDTAEQQAKGEVKIKNSGFTKETKEHASKPIVLEGFSKVWANHVNEMSMYHAFVLPLEDFYRVYNYQIRGNGAAGTEGVKASIQNAHGTAAISYIEQMLKDLNGGAVSDSRETLSKSLVSKHKKAATMASLSVIVQQPTAIFRAMSLIDPKYFKAGGAWQSIAHHKKLWNEVKAAAPVAQIKEMGRFDINMGQSAEEYLNGKEYRNPWDKGFDWVDEKLSRPAEWMDEYAWNYIWYAVKRETLSKNPKMSPVSTEFMAIAGARFTEVIAKTQVYDSVLSRSANMRSKGLFMTMATSFMAEPTTSINMLQSAMLSGNKKTMIRTTSAVLASTIVNAALVSFVYAMRDDDKDETYREKYLASLSGKLLEGINPLTYIPFARDIWSIFQGFDVERADMSLISDAVDALKALIAEYAKDTEGMDETELEAHDKAILEGWLSVADTLGSFVGLPIRNVRREINAIANTIFIANLDKTRATTKLSIRHAVEAELLSSIPVIGWVSGKSSSDKLYEAIITGDTAYVARLKQGYSVNGYSTAVRKALRENDPRIREAAVAKFNGDQSEYLRIVTEIANEGFFSQTDIRSAVDTLVNGMSESESSSSSKTKGWFDADDFGIAVARGDTQMADNVRDDIISTQQTNGKTASEAEESFRSTARSQVKQLFADDALTEQRATDLLVQYGGYDHEGAEGKVAEWKYEKEHSELDGKITYSQYQRWVADGKSRGVSLEMYTDVTEYRGGDASSGVRSQEEVAAYIDSLTNDVNVKDALWCCFWSESTLYKNAPWR